jgi:hypothetical protein
MSRVIAAFTQFFDDDGDPLVNGWLSFLMTGTTSTLKNTYSDEDLLIANANPVQLDAAGRCPDIFGSGRYKVISYMNNPVISGPGTQIQVFDPVIVPGVGSTTDLQRNIIDPDDASWQGDTAVGVAGEAMIAADQGKLLCCKDEGDGARWFFYDPDSTNADNYTYLPLAILLSADSFDAGDLISITSGNGILALDGLAGTIAEGEVGQPVYAITDGISVTPPSDSGDVIKQIGTVLDRAANERDIFQISFDYLAMKR